MFLSKEDGAFLGSPPRSVGKGARPSGLRDAPSPRTEAQVSCREGHTGYSSHHSSRLQEARDPGLRHSWEFSLLSHKAGVIRSLRRNLCLAYMFPPDTLEAFRGRRMFPLTGGQRSRHPAAILSSWQNAGFWADRASGGERYGEDQNQACPQTPELSLTLRTVKTQHITSDSPKTEQLIAHC